MCEVVVDCGASLGNLFPHFSSRKVCKPLVSHGEGVVGVFSVIAVFQPLLHLLPEYSIL